MGIHRLANSMTLAQHIKITGMGGDIGFYHKKASAQQAVFTKNGRTVVT